MSSRSPFFFALSMAVAALAGFEIYGGDIVYTIASGALCGLLTYFNFFKGGGPQNITATEELFGWGFFVALVIAVSTLGLNTIWVLAAAIIGFLVSKVIKEAVFAS